MHVDRVAVTLSMMTCLAQATFTQFFPCQWAHIIYAIDSKARLMVYFTHSDGP